MTYKTHCNYHLITAEPSFIRRAIDCLYQTESTLECGPMPNVMATQPNIGGALRESSVIPILVPCHKVWLTAAARVSCSNAANIRERKTWGRKVNFAAGKIPLACNSPPPKCTVYIIYQRRRRRNIVHTYMGLQSGERRCCSNETKTRNPLKFAGVPQTPEQIAAVSGPKFATLWAHVEEILLFNSFSDCRYMP